MAEIVFHRFLITFDFNSVLTNSLNWTFASISKQTTYFMYSEGAGKTKNEQKYILTIVVQQVTNKMYRQY